MEEIDRLEYNGQIVTVTDVRKTIVQGKIKGLVPKSTYNYLKEKGVLEV